MHLTPLVFSLALASPALSHGNVQYFTTNGQRNQGFLLDYYYNIQNHLPVPDIAAWYAENLDLGFVSPAAYATADIICHKAAKPGAITASIPAGGTVQFHWEPVWPHPYGPILTYVAKCPAGSGGCTNVDKTTLKWVKIAEEGIDLATQTWAQAKLVQQNGTWAATVPKSLAPGNYVFRHELIALHGANSVNGAQNYPQCFNIQITGSGTANPEGTLGTALYKSTDPGIYLNPYQTLTNYTIPGPALFRG